MPRPMPREAPVTNAAIPFEDVFAIVPPPKSRPAPPANPKAPRPFPKSGSVLVPAQGNWSWVISRRAPRARRDARLRAKHPREMKRVGKAEGCRHLLHPRARLAQPLRRQPHPATAQVVARRGVEKALEEPTHRLGAQPRRRRDLRRAFQARGLGVHQRPAALEARPRRVVARLGPARPRRRARARLARGRELEQEHPRQMPHHRLRGRPRPSALAQQPLEHLAHLARRVHPAHAPLRQARRAQRRLRPRALQPEVVAPQGPAHVAAAAAPRLRSRHIDRARRQRLPAPANLRLPPAAVDVFDFPIRKIPPLRVAPRRQRLPAAADHPPARARAAPPAGPEKAPRLRRGRLRQGRRRLVRELAARFTHGPMPSARRPSRQPKAPAR